MENRELLISAPEVPLLEGPQPKEGDFSGYWMGGGPGEPGWIPPGEESEVVGDVIDVEFEDITPKGEKDKKERLIEEMQAWAKAHGYAEPQTYEEAKAYLKQKNLRERFLSEQAKTSLEEIRSKRRKYRREYRPQPGKWIKTYLKPRPQTDLAKIFFPGRALRDMYIPKPPVKTTLEQIKEIREVSAPGMGVESPLGSSQMPSLERLRMAGNPPPSAEIRSPARDPEKFEGLGPTLVRLRSQGSLPRIDQAVLTEVQANGDIDTSSHIKNEVGRLGFSGREVDISLKRLRDLGLLVPTGKVSSGEQELMLSGGSHG